MLSRIVSRSSLTVAQNLRGKNKEFNLILRRSIYEKKISKPAPYITKAVIVDKIMNSLPFHSMLLVGFIGWTYFFVFNGVDFNEIKDFKELKAR